jgi:hypothetical protein
VTRRDADAFEVPFEQERLDGDVFSAGDGAESGAGDAATLLDAITQV